MSHSLASQLDKDHSFDHNTAIIEDFLGKLQEEIVELHSSANSQSRESSNPVNDSNFSQHNFGYTDEEELNEAVELYVDLNRDFELPPPPEVRIILPKMTLVDYLIEDAVIQELVDAFNH